MGSASGKTGNELSIILMSTLALLSCATTDQTLLLQPLPSDPPVSISDSVIINGQVYRRGDFSKLESFTFEKSIRFPMTSRQITLDLSPDLCEIAARAQADAITDLTIQLRDVKHRDYTWVMFERASGFWICTGITCVVASLLIQQRQLNTPADDLLIFGVGAAFIGVSYIHESLGSTIFVLKMSGNAAKLK
jgi:hypothetical protein